MTVSVSGRRRFLAASALLVAASFARAQGRTPRPRIGVLMPSTASETANLTAAFAQGLRERGYAPGENVEVLYRFSDGQAQRLAELTRELAGEQVAVIVTTTDTVVRAVMQQAASIPVVMVNTSDPVGNRLVATLGRPGGNVTGLTNLSPEISGKRVELLKECVPGLSRLAYLWNPRLAGAAEGFEEVKAAAKRIGLEFVPLEARRAEDIPPAFADIASPGSTALLVQAPNPMLYTQRAELCRLATVRRLPSMFNRVEYVQAGGLMSYGPSVPEMYRRAAAYVDRILKGEKAGDLPVEQPTKFELTLSVKTARAIGLMVPPALLARAERIFD